MDLRQIGLALVVTKDDMIPLFHHSYEGNMNDAKVFRKVIEKIKNRLETSCCHYFRQAQGGTNSWDTHFIGKL